MADGVGACRRCKAALVRWFVEPVLTEDDATGDVERKRALVSVLLGCIVTILLANVVMLGDGFTLTLENVSLVIGLVFCAVAYLWLRRVRCASDALCGTVVVVMCLVVMATDLQSATRYSNRTWSCFLLVLDFCLVCDLSSSITHAVVCSSAVWVVVMAVEASHRVGLYDLPGLSAMDKRLAITDCDAPPCPVNDVGTSAIPSLAVLGVDFIMTRSFCRAMHQGQERMQRAIGVAETVAEDLAAFDLTSAQRRLAADAHSLPPAFQSAFLELLHNLECYKPYLPHSLLSKSLHAAEPAAAADTARAPGADAPAEEPPTVAIMFTDVRASTQIWSACPHGMKEALALHNKCIRAAIDTFSGYEVKVIGDAFMVAFSSLENALRCGTAIQEEMLDMLWPAALLELPECAPDDDGIWGGLCLRIGIDAGPVDLEMNELTRRYDYFGETVNRAARLEAQCPPGSVAGRASALRGLLSKLDVPAKCLRVTSVELKGFSGSMEMAAVVPKGCAGRWECTHEMHRSAMQPIQLQRVQASMSVTSTASADAMSSGSSGSSHRRSTLRVRQLFTHEPATVGALLVDTPSDFWTISPGALQVFQAIFERLLTCLTVTGGVVVSTVHSRAVVSWSGGTLAHCEASLRFVSMFRYHSRSLRGCEPSVVIGIASGASVRGAVGSAAQRFITTLGMPVGVALDLASKGSAWGTPNLYGCVGTCQASAHNVELVKRTETLEVGDGGKHVVTLYEARVEDGHSRSSVRAAGRSASAAGSSRSASSASSRSAQSFPAPSVDFIRDYS
eukprot:TRINITY_DN2518_c3_g1_i1.p1 TRINITY_DN2518_c3_g1~~TRINITY_DN2518_c3_g1_i1.p1  ORF type:complete len:790 (+),score=135.72 TRINITY_DN2518_c3_g1_i1:69-2438(+)